MKRWETRKYLDTTSSSSCLANSGLKVPIKTFLFQTQSLFLHETLHIDKFKGPDFKYNNSFFQISVQKYPNKAILLPILIFFL